MNKSHNHTLQKFISGLAPALLCALASCSTPAEPTTAGFGYEYLPLRVGDYQQYTVSSTRYLAGNATQQQYELQAVVVDSFATGNEGYSYIVQRSTRPDANTAWQPLDSWTIRRNSMQAVITESSTPFLKLSFPVTEGKSWNGNAFNTREANEFCGTGDAYTCDMYQATNVGKPYTGAANLSFNTSVTVVENDNQDFISFQDKRIAIYAKDVGLVYREIDSLEYCTAPACLGKQRVEKGVIYVQKITAYGHR